MKTKTFEINPTCSIDKYWKSFFRWQNMFRHVVRVSKYIKSRRPQLKLFIWHDMLSQLINEGNMNVRFDIRRVSSYGKFLNRSQNYSIWLYQWFGPTLKISNRGLTNPFGSSTSHEKSIIGLIDRITQYEVKFHSHLSLSSIRITRGFVHIKDRFDPIKTLSKIKWLMIISPMQANNLSWIRYVK